MADDIQARPGRGLRIALVLSLALNLLVLGAVGGALIRGGGWHHRGAPGMAAMGGPLTRALAPEDRRALVREMHEMHEMRGAGHGRGWPDGAIGAEFAGLVADLRATPYDPGAVAARLERLQARFRDRIGRGQALLMARLAAMDDAGRAAYADRLEAELRRQSERGAFRRPDDSQR